MKYLNKIIDALLWGLVGVLGVMAGVGILVALWHLGKSAYEGLFGV